MGAGTTPFSTRNWNWLNWRPPKRPPWRTSSKCLPVRGVGRMSGKLDELPGLKHFIEVLKSHGLGADFEPPVEGAPRAGELVAGDRFDPLLAKLYELCNGGQVGDLQLFGLTRPGGGLAKFNAATRESEE